MHAVRLMRRRARAHVGLLTLVLLQVTLTTAAVAGAVGYVSVAERDGLVTMLAGAAPDHAATRVQAPLGSDPAAQRSATDAVLADLLAGLPVHVHAGLATGAVPAAIGSGTAAPAGSVDSAVLWSDDALAEVAELVVGTWPGAPPTNATAALPAALQADAADRLDLVPGDTVALSLDDGTTTLEITGTWRARDPEDPRWFGDPLISQGSTDEGATAGPFVVATDALVGLKTRVHARWTVVPDLGEVQSHDLPALRDALAAAEDTLEADPTTNTGSVRVEDGLGETLGGLTTRLGGVRGVTSTAVLLVVLTGLVALSQVARLLSEVRLPETLTLRSRGTSVGQLTAAALVEAGVVGLIGAAAGSLGATAVLRSQRPVTLGAPVSLGAPVAVAVLGALASALVLGWQARAHAVEAVRAGRSDAAGRTRRGAQAGTVGLVTVAATLAWWRLERAGAPVVAGADGYAHVDPLAVTAVSLGLLAVALAGLVLLAPAAALLARAAARRRDLLPALALRELARHTPVHAVTVVVVTLAVGTGVVVAAYSGTLDAWRSDARRAAVGADVRLDLTSGPTTAVPLVTASWPGAEGVAPVRVVSLSASGAQGEVLGVSTATGLAPVDTPTAAALTTDLPPTLPLPPDARQVDLTATIDAGLDAAPPLTARVWLVDEAGDLVVLGGAAPGSAADSADQRSSGTAASYAWTLGVPGSGGWQVAAVDVTYPNLPEVPGTGDHLPAGFFPDEPPAGWTGPWPPDDTSLPRPDVTVRLTSLTAGDGVADTDLLDAAGGWGAVAFTGLDPEELGADGTTVTLTRPAAVGGIGAPLRFLPGRTPPLALVVTSAWLAGTDAGIGDTTRMTVGGRSVPVVLAAETAVVPGSAAAADQVVAGLAGDDPAPVLTGLVDLRSLVRLLLTTRADVPLADQLWVATAEPDEVAAAIEADRLGGTGPVVGHVETAAPQPDPLADPALWAVRLAAACALLVMVPGVASAALALALGRRRETAVLRALGVSAVGQGRARAAELALVAGVATAGGVAGGALVAWLCVAPLVRATTPGPAALPATVVANVPQGLGLLAAAVVLLSAVVSAYGAQVTWHAARATRVEEER